LREAEEASRAKGKRGRLKLRDELADLLSITPSEATGRIETAKAKRRAQRRSLVISAPDEEGMRRVSGWLTPALGVLLDAHASIEELAKAGSAVMANGVRVPVWDLVKKASAVIPYFALFKDQAKRIPLNLWRARRLANQHQRAVLGVNDEGCTHPGCAVSAAHCAEPVCALALPASGPLRSARTHHMREWRDSGLTNIDGLTLVCDYHHHVIDKGWKVEKINGVVHWTVPGETEAGVKHHRRAAA
jgi:hypothetical protein